MNIEASLRKRTTHQNFLGCSLYPGPIRKLIAQCSTNPYVDLKQLNLVI